MKAPYLIITLLILTSVNSIGYVLQCPGTIHYNTYQTITFSDCVNSSYFECGPDYFILSDVNITIEDLDMHYCDYNLSYFNDTFKVSNHRFLEFNATYTSIGNYDFILYMGGNTSYYIDFYVDDVQKQDDITATGTKYYFQHRFTGPEEKYTFFFDGFDVGCPTNGSSKYNTTGHSLNLTWDAGLYSDACIVVRNNDSYPTSITDGNIVQNDTLEYYNTTINTTGYFSIWCYNTSLHKFSPDSCKLDIPWGVLEIYRVYNESNPSMEISPFGLLISNESGTQTY